MMVRIWRTAVNLEREPEYKRFQNEESLPMFKAKEGCLGVLFLREPAGWAALSFWRDEYQPNGSALSISRSSVRR